MVSQQQRRQVPWDNRDTQTLRLRRTVFIGRLNLNWSTLFRRNQDHNFTAAGTKSMNLLDFVCVFSVYPVCIYYITTNTLEDIIIPQNYDAAAQS